MKKVMKRETSSNLLKRLKSLKQESRNYKQWLIIGNVSKSLISGILNALTIHSLLVAFYLTIKLIKLKSKQTQKNNFRLELSHNSRGRKNKQTFQEIFLQDSKVYFPIWWETKNGTHISKKYFLEFEKFL